MQHHQIVEFIKDLAERAKQTDGLLVVDPLIGEGESYQFHAVEATAATITLRYTSNQPEDDYDDPDDMPFGGMLELQIAESQGDSVTLKKQELQFISEGERGRMYIEYLDDSDFL